MSHVSATESAFVSLDSLAETGGQSLNFIWWIAGILVLAGLVIVFAAVASKRKRAAAETPAEPVAAETAASPAEAEVAEVAESAKTAAHAEPAASAVEASSDDADPASDNENPNETK